MQRRQQQEEEAGGQASLVTVPHPVLLGVCGCGRAAVTAAAQQQQQLALTGLLMRGSITQWRRGFTHSYGHTSRAA